VQVIRKQGDKPRGKRPSKPGRPPFKKKSTSSKPGAADLPKTDSELIRLNRYLAIAGICSRREADDLIKAGLVTVNGELVTEMGYKVKPTDLVKYDGGTIRGEKSRFILLNKPKGYITTMEDPRGRKTVMTLIERACKERVYPVGRLDRNTLGLLLFTNDGDMAKKLTHPKHGVEKLYYVETAKKVTMDQMKKLKAGIALEDGVMKVDEVEFVGDGSNHRQLGVKIHSGKNRIVRRLFEHLGHDVVKLDRVMFAGLTKKDLPRGRWRFLSDEEVGFLKML
jgi:23S rRNA pseudouridine2605 synthase